MSKWKKIGSVHSGDDNKSNRSVRSRSRDQMPTQSFRQNVARMKLSCSDMIDSQNTYFCKNYIDRKKETSSNRSLSRIRTEKSLPTQKEDMMRSTISKKKISKDDDNESHASRNDLQKTEPPKKLKQFAKQSQLKALKEEHLRLKEYVKYEINTFKAAFKDLEAELKFEINYKKEAQAQKIKTQTKAPSIIPIVPYRFDSKILDNLNYSDVGNKKPSGKTPQQSEVNILNQIRTEARLCIDSLNEFQNERMQILQKFKDINLQELLA